MNPVLRIRIQLIFSLTVACVCALFLVDSFNYPVSLREPLGAAFVPRWVACITLFLSVALAWQSRGEMHKALLGAAKKGVPAPDTAYRKRFFGSICIMAAYAVLLQWPVLPSLLVTPLFLFVFVIALGGRGGKTVAAAACIALVLGVSLHLLFRDVLYVNLP